MGSLNPEWLSIESERIDAASAKWSKAISMSYQAVLRALATAEVNIDTLEHDGMILDMDEWS
jgi:hypothetical protein